MPPHASIKARRTQHGATIMTASEDLFAAMPAPPEKVTFEPTRGAGLARMEQFVTRTGAHYASKRNYDLGPNNRSTVSALSPWVRHRLITEEEVLTQTLRRYSPSTACLLYTSPSPRD